ncbi:MAG: O-antigen ligase family protein [Verrucomicrobiales bacterium]|nr:O-antigen ligase family protein [Verrucomicrobiales bacterium]MCP5526687.1 O-antigen ligase family protein [Verrucomicrobiales bacterium]
MTAIDWVKLGILLPLFGVVAPVAGVWLKGRERWQLGVFAVMCFMTLNGLMGPSNWGLTVASIETYRGHTKGYHFYFNHALAVALITARRLEGREGFRWAPPLLLPYLAYCGLSLLSVLNAPDHHLVLMTAHKMAFASLLLIATFNLLRTTEHLQYFLRVMAGVMFWEALVCLKLKYADGMYQVRGTFEHQNPLAMYAIAVGMPLLAAGLGPAFRGGNRCLAGFLACALVVQCTLSRAALAAFALGTIGVMVVSLLDKPTVRRWSVAAGMGVVGAVGLLLTADTIVARFNDHGNQASSELREVMKDACREMVRDHPLGIGWNNYALVVNPPYRYAEVYYDWIRGRGMRVDETKANSVVESHYYLLLAETGYPGLAAWLLVIGLAWWRNLRAFLAFGHSFQRSLSLGIAAGCALNYLQSTLERVLTQPRNLMLWLILMGVTGRLEQLRRERRRAAVSQRPSATDTHEPHAMPPP